MPIGAATKIHGIRKTREKNSRPPLAKKSAPAKSPISSGQPKFRFKLSAEVFRHASNGPTPVRNSSNNPMGILTLLKNGAPTLIFDPENHSENTGKSVPESTAMQ